MAEELIERGLIEEVAYLLSTAGTVAGLCF
jgi:hypothetical protein